MTNNNNNKWIEWNWTPEKPYPDDECKVYIRHNDGWESSNCDYPRRWKWDLDTDGSIVTHYRLA